MELAGLRVGDSLPLLYHSDEPEMTTFASNLDASTRKVTACGLAALLLLLLGGLVPWLRKDRGDRPANPATEPPSL
jgi:hypothetical protein